MLYARIVGGIVVEIIQPALDDDGNEVAIADRFTAELVDQMVDITSVSPEPSQGFTYANGDFAEPQPITRSPAEILSDNSRERDRLLSVAGLAIAPLQDAVDLDIAEATETALLKQWKQYRVAVNRIDLTLAIARWPDPPVSPSYLEAGATQTA